MSGIRRHQPRHRSPCPRRAIRICATWRIASAPLPMDAVQHANSGHPGMPMGMADIATVLFKDFLQFDPADPHWLDRDRFVISNGHGSMLLYSLLYLTGYKDMTIEEIEAVPSDRQQDRRPSRNTGHADGIETDDRPAGPGHRELGRHGAGRADHERQFGDDAGQPLHLCLPWAMAA